MKDCLCHYTIGRVTEASTVQAGLLGVSIAGELLRRSSTQLCGQLPGSPLPAAAAETTARPLPTPPSAQSRSGDGSSARTSQEATGGTSPGEQPFVALTLAEA